MRNRKKRKRNEIKDNTSMRMQNNFILSFNHKLFIINLLIFL